MMNIPDAIFAVAVICFIAAVVVAAALVTEWVTDKLGEERTRNLKAVASFLGRLVLSLAIRVEAATTFLVRLVVSVAIMTAIIMFWRVPDIWGQPLAALTLGDLAENIFKLVVLVVLGSVFLRWLFLGSGREDRGDLSDGSHDDQG